MQKYGRSVDESGNEVDGDDLKPGNEVVKSGAVQDKGKKKDELKEE